MNPPSGDWNLAIPIKSMMKRSRPRSATHQSKQDRRRCRRCCCRRHARFVLPIYPIYITFLLACSGVFAAASPVESYFNRVKDNPLLLRHFLYQFPKGGELHSHLDGAIYAENYIAWAAADGKCIDVSTFIIELPPCDASLGRPKVAAIQFDPVQVNAIIDAFSIRNYETGSLSAHAQFFATFQRYLAVSQGRQGSMLAEVTARAARQNTWYLELMQSYGMAQARTLATQDERFNGSASLVELASLDAVETLVTDTLAFTEQVEAQWREELGCNDAPNYDGNPAPNYEFSIPGCFVEVRYLAQVIRTFPRAQVLAQTLLAFKLIERDSRYVGLNFVAPEDASITLRDYRVQMEIIRDLAALFPASSRQVTLHAGELALPLVPPEALRRHIYEAVHIAGARRIGHGVDVIYEDNPMALLEHMAEQQILVEINLTSNAMILGVEGAEHPFALYRSQGVPLALSTDDEGVARIDLTHEYVRATQTYDLDYAYLKELARNALGYSFLPGANLFIDIPQAKQVTACARDSHARKPSTGCQEFLARSEKARLQWHLEERLHLFEAQYKE